jgi:hypothetical protein
MPILAIIGGFALFIGGALLLMWVIGKNSRPGDVP